MFPDRVRPLRSGRLRSVAHVANSRDTHARSNERMPLPALAAAPGTPNSDGM